MATTIESTLTVTSVKRHGAADVVTLVGSEYIEPIVGGDWQREVTAAEILVVAGKVTTGTKFKVTVEVAS